MAQAAALSNCPIGDYNPLLNPNTNAVDNADNGDNTDHTDNADDAHDGENAVNRDNADNADNANNSDHADNAVARRGRQIQSLSLSVGVSPHMFVFLCQRFNQATLAPSPLTNEHPTQAHRQTKSPISTLAHRCMMFEHFSYVNVYAKFQM